MALRDPRDDVEHRLPVWKAMSEFFLDTEITDRGVALVARTCADSPYSLPELDRIMFCEVGRAFSANTVSMAGEWGGWSEDFVRQRGLRTYKPWTDILYL